MADIFDEIFGDDDSDAEFEGFEAEDIVQMNGHMLPTFQIPDLDEDGDIEADIRLGWKRETRDPVTHPFTGQPGMKIPMDEMTPYNFFKLFIGDSEFQNMSTETNRYYQQNFKPDTLKKFSRMRSWFDITSDEMEQFIGLIILMGLTDKPYLEKYWSTDSLISTPIFSKTMPRDRFLNILTCFHLNNNENQVARGADGYDPLFKVKPLYDVTRQNFLRVYTPEQHLSLDEGMVPWRGRLSFKQYIPNKPDKFGMKMYILCDAKTGYMSTYEVYTGKGYDPNPDACDEEAALGHSFNVVMGLLRKCDLLDKGYSLYTDNYYTSPKLFDTLDSRLTHAVGTARLNRKEIPVALKNAKLKKGEVIFRQRNNLMAMKWKDKRDVSMLSTKHTPTFSVTARVDRQTGEPIVIPSCILEYNSYMGGVDRADQLGKYYTITRKSLKWWKKLAMHIINMAITNAYILYAQFVENPCSHFDFRKSLAREMIGKHTSRLSRKGRRPSGVPESRLTERHFPSLIPAQEGAKNQRPCRKCVVCNTNSGKRHTGGASRKRKETRYWCPDCGKALCVEDCFRRYHTLKNYRVNGSDSDVSSESD